MNNIKGLLLYIPSILYIATFSLLMNKGFSLNEIPSVFNVLLSLNIPVEANISGILVFLVKYGILFEFLFISIILYFLVKIIFKKIIPYKEDTIFPAIIVMGYISWSFPIINYVLPCDGRMCKFLSLYPLSFFIEIINKLFPKMSFEISLVLSFVLIVTVLYSILVFTYKDKIKSEP